MTKEEKIRGLYNLKEYLVKNPIELDGHKSLPITLIDYAIESLEQQPMDAKTYLKRREENYVEYNVEWFLKNWEIELEILSGGKIKPMDADCISRQAVLDLTGKSDWFESSDDYNDFVFAVCNLPSVTPKSEYSWKEIKIKFECDDCISRQAVIQKINNKLNPCTDMFKCLEMSEIKEDVENLPSVKPTRPKGKWIVLDECANEGVYCSKCHKTVFKLEFNHTMKWRNFKYCPNCGAEMEVEG